MISINPTEAELLNVLIVEDDPDDVYVLERAVSRAVLDGGWRLRLQVVGNGLEAINFVTWHDVVNDLPDIVILDLNMPVIDGVGFLKSLRNSLDFRDLRVVVLTTSADRTIHRTALDAGAALGRPYEQEPELVARPQEACLVAAWLWHQRGLNELADQLQVDAIARHVREPGAPVLRERRALYRGALATLHRLGSAAQRAGAETRSRPSRVAAAGGASMGRANAREAAHCSAGTP